MFTKICNVIESTDDKIKKLTVTFAVGDRSWREDASETNIFDGGSWIRRCDFRIDFL